MTCLNIESMQRDKINDERGRGARSADCLASRAATLSSSAAAVELARRGEARRGAARRVFRVKKYVTRLGSDAFGRR